MALNSFFSIVCLGDSTTAGTPGFFSPRERPPEGMGNPESQYAYWLLQRHPDWKVYNRGVRGQRTDQMLRRFNWDVPPHQPDVVVILGGVNDINQGKDLTLIQENLTKLYDLSLEQNALVLTCSILPLNMFETDQKAKILLMNQWIKETAAKRKFGFCDTYRTLENPMRAGFLVNSPDEIHPDVEGYKKMGFTVAEAIEALNR